MSVKYSVIIPVYNAEKTLRRCLDSLLSQSYADCELILVNDGSSDGSGELCREYAAKHRQVCVVDKENGGVSSARNVGLDRASGKYVVFVDSDDYAADNYFSLLDQTLELADCDWLQFSNCIDSGSIKRERIYDPLILDSRSKLLPALIDAICRKRINPPWAKLYRRELIEKHHIRFPLGVSVAEDRAFNIKYSMYIQSFLVSSSVLYTVSTENENSLSRRRHVDLAKQFAVTRLYFEDALTEASIPDHEKDQYRRAVNFGDCRGIYHDAKLMIADHTGWLERQRKLGKLCDEINHKHMKYPHTRYCTLITLPVRLRLTLVIDAIAWKLTH